LLCRSKAINNHYCHHRLGQLMHHHIRNVDNIIAIIITIIAQATFTGISIAIIIITSSITDNKSSPTCSVRIQIIPLMPWCPIRQGSTD